MNNNQKNTIYTLPRKLTAIILIIYLVVFGFVSVVSFSGCSSSGNSGNSSNLCVACHRNPRYKGQLCKSCYSEWLRNH